MYYSLETWNVYLNLAAFNPGIDKHNIVKENSFAIAAELIEDSKGHNLFKQRGLITSCDSLSCFVLFKDMDKLFFEKDIVLELFDAKISQKNKSSKDKKIFQLTPACRNDVGIGFLASRQKEEQITWQQNYRFMKRRGIF